MESSDPFWSPRHRPSPAFVRHVLVTTAIVAGAYLLWQVRDALLVAFAAVIVAVLLVAASAPLKRWSGLSRRTSVITTAVVIVVLLGLIFLLIGAQVANQFGELSGQLTQAVQSVESRLGFQLMPGQDGGQAGGIFSSALRFVQQFSSFGLLIAEVVTGAILVGITGVFLAIEPDLYRGGFVKLFPPKRQQQTDETLGSCGVSLYHWLMGQLVAMVIVGVLVGLGVWLIGLPAPLALGIFAGLAEFVPIIGPIVGAIPALLLALTQGGTAVLWTALLFLAVQQLESNMIMPLIQRRAVTIPPALFLLTVFAFGMLFGLLGVIVAGPLTVVAYVVTKKLYVRDILDEPTQVPGEHQPGPQM